MSGVLRAPHPVRSAQVQEAIERWTEAALRDSGGSGRVSIEFDFKDGHGVSVSSSFKGPRLRLLRPSRAAEHGGRR